MLQKSLLRCTKSRVRFPAPYKIRMGYVLARAYKLLGIWSQTQDQNLKNIFIVKVSLGNIRHCHENNKVN